MSDSIITVALTEVTSILKRQIQREFRLVVGVEKEIENLESTLQNILAVLVDVPAQIKEKPVEVWLEKLKDVSYDMDDLLGEWSTAILLKDEGSESTALPKQKVCFYITFPCFSYNRVVLRREIALKIKDINNRLDVIAREKDRYNLNMMITGGEGGPERLRTSSFIDVSEVRGRDHDKNTLVNKLLLCESESRANHHQAAVAIISVVGLGGIGKTTLAQLLYDEMKDQFDIRMWVCVSEPFDQIRVAKAIVEDVNGNAPNLAELETVLRHVCNSISGKKFLLVLDDVWTEDYRKWEPLKHSLQNGACGSKILVTTRNERVARMMGTTHTHRLGQLSNQDSWSLFRSIAFFERSREDIEKLQHVGRKIADKCKGLPLAVKTIGSLMRFKNTVEDWQNVLDSKTWELEEAESDLFPPLLLSYYDLPSALKRCFLYCAFFPKDHKMETDNLIKLWMAQGYLSPRKGTEIEGRVVEFEIRGREYLENLVMRSFFQDTEKDKGSDNIVRFKMHDMVHDFAQFLTKKECFILKVDSSIQPRMDSFSKKPRHLTLIRAEEAPFPVPINNTDKLHTFWVQSFYDCPPIVSDRDSVHSDWFDRLRCLKALDLSRNRLYELPAEVGKLIILKYLNLSHNPLGVLPETVCDLINLQTLKLVACAHLSKLPEQMEKLINLRHLEIDRTDGLKWLPKGIGNLSSLRTLSKFVAGSSGDSEAAACKLGDLKNLNHLRGKLKIEGLGYVADAVEAEKAELKNKKHLLDLYLDFYPLVKAEGITDVVEALQLHPNLHYLHIKSYGGTQFPNWMLSLINLRKLQLQECQNCVRLPPLGGLPSLETLYIEDMHSLKSVGLEFLGIGNNNDGGGGDSTTTNDGTRASSTVVIAFPKLKKLKIGKMRSWEEWDVISTRGEAEDIKIMPCLRCLKISRCNKLKALPYRLLQVAPVKKLRIKDCPVLQKRYKREIGEDWSKISHIPKVRI
uniref:Putative disease resistance protein RGA2-like n=1 Tax=Davidia involucrata TaxID=16924 RepID=A0A5B6YSD2_DAVIN